MFAVTLLVSSVNVHRERLTVPARMKGLPDGYFACQWCKGGVRFTKVEATGEQGWPDRCPHCEMHPHPGKVDETVGGKVDPEKAKTVARNRRTEARVVPLAKVGVGQPVLGVDPGARYTGIVLRDGDTVLLATTLVRLDEQNPFQWMHHVVAEVRALLFSQCPPETLVGIEGVSVPKGFKHGQRAALNPGPILMTGVVAGGVSCAFPEAPIIPPGGNGSQHITNYPPELVGRRPKDLAGTSNSAGTRAHEQSAYDVAGKSAKILYPKTGPALTGLRG